MDGELCAGKKLFAEHFDLSSLRAFLPSCREGFIAAAHESESGFFGVGHKPVTVHGDTVFTPQIRKVAAFFRACTDLGHRDRFKYRL